MSLHENLGGILETQVTWEEFERNLRTSLKTKARFGQAKKVIDIGEGFGYASRCGLVSCDWKDDDASEKLPSTIVIKIPSALPARQVGLIQGDESMWDSVDQSLRNVHNIEVATYKFFEEFDGLRIPKMYYGISFTPEDRFGGQICLEYVDNSRAMNFHEAHTVKQLTQIARALGEVQAASLRKETNAPEFDIVMNADFAKKVSLEMLCGMFKGLLAFDSSDKTKELLRKIEKILPEYYASTLASTLHKQMRFRPVLVNGDLRTENVLIDKDTGDLASLIDWQCTHFGVGVEDLLRITLFALPAKERRESSATLVEEMYKNLVANLDGAEPPYSLAKFRTLFNILFPHCALYFSGIAIVIMEKQSQVLKLSIEEMEEMKAVQIDKVIGALEDILVYHEKNKELVKDLKFRDY